MTSSTKTGDMYACQTCSCEIQIVKDCDCEKQCSDFRCCGEPMQNITEPAVRRADDQSVDDGLELSD